MKSMSNDIRSLVAKGEMSDKQTDKANKSFVYVFGRLGLVIILCDLRDFSFQIFSFWCQNILYVKAFCTCRVCSAEPIFIKMQFITLWKSLRKASLWKFLSLLSHFNASCFNVGKIVVKLAVK